MAKSADRPAIIIHGVMCLKEMMLPLQLSLKEGGVQSYTVDMPFLNLGDIRNLSQQFAKSLEQTLSDIGAEKCDLVGVSMGGLIGLYYLKKIGGASHVHRFVTLGTAFQGSWSALGGAMALSPFTDWAGQYLPGSPLLQELAQAPLPPEVECVSISVQGDPLCPPESSVLEGAENIALEVHDFPRAVVHQGMIFSKTVAAKLIDVLLASSSSCPL